MALYMKEKHNWNLSITLLQEIFLLIALLEQGMAN